MIQNFLHFFLYMLQHCFDNSLILFPFAIICIIGCIHLFRKLGG